MAESRQPVGSRRHAAAWALLAAALAVSVPTQTTAADDLKLLISVEQPAIAAPYPARVTLHFHNGGEVPLWLYHRARSQTGEGSTLEVRLEPLSVPAGVGIDAPGRGSVFESVGLPRPRLVRLDAGEDATEKNTINLLPAQAGPKEKGTPLWGRYRLSVVSRAQYSNATEMERILGIKLWQGEVASNSVEIELQPPVGAGSITGTAARADGRGILDALVSLSDEQERLVSQTVTDPLGKVRCEIVWTNGAVIENVKGETADDGLISLELIPGPNFLTLRQRGCPTQDQRLVVPQEGGIDGFSLQLECEKK
ncbi:MAG: hypothetical protein LAO07_10140 [Acidobacteriia bacterium]|nr:hypothetical protein [Terriglobia bacterium]